MVELELSGLLLMWNRSSVMAVPGALCATLMGIELASALPYLDAGKTIPGNQGEKTENDQSSTWKLVPKRMLRGRRGEGLRFDRENAHHP
jgi:hypothetical protein